MFSGYSSVEFGTTSSDATVTSTSESLSSTVMITLGSMSSTTHYGNTISSMTSNSNLFSGDSSIDLGTPSSDVVSSSSTAHQAGLSASSPLNSGGQDESTSTGSGMPGSGTPPIGLSATQAPSFDVSGISGQTSSDVAGLQDSSLASGGSYQAGLVSQTSTGTGTPAPGATAPGNHVGSTRDSGISSSLTMQSSSSGHGSGGESENSSISGNGGPASASHDNAGASGITSVGFEQTSSFSLHSFSPTAIISPGLYLTTTNIASWNAQSSSMNAYTGNGNESGSAGPGNQQIDPSYSISSGDGGQHSLSSVGTNSIQISGSGLQDSATSSGLPGSTERGNQQLDPSSGISGKSGQQSFTGVQTNAVHVSGSGSASRDSTISNGVSASTSNFDLASLSSRSVLPTSASPGLASVSGRQSDTKGTSYYLGAPTSGQQAKSSYTNLPQSRSSSLSAQIGATVTFRGTDSSLSSRSSSDFGFDTAHDASRTGIASPGATPPAAESSATYQHTGPSLTISRPLGNTGTDKSDVSSGSANTTPAQLPLSSSDTSGEAASTITGTSLFVSRTPGSGVSPGNNFQRTSGSALTSTPLYGQFPSSAVPVGSPGPGVTGNDTQTGTRTANLDPGSLSNETLSTTITNPIQRTDISSGSLATSHCLVRLGVVEAARANAWVFSHARCAAINTSNNSNISEFHSTSQTVNIDSAGHTEYGVVRVPNVFKHIVATIFERFVAPILERFVVNVFKNFVANFIKYFVAILERFVPDVVKHFIPIFERFIASVFKNFEANVIRHFVTHAIEHFVAIP
ncbi:hypothetical protein LA080_007953 [Diaporthe eres]|nr:hypothetical protein LA080_007953 [Diaporthe eres]